jgi:hypothetical protein
VDDVPLLHTFSVGSPRLCLGRSQMRFRHRGDLSPC